MEIHKLDTRGDRKDTLTPNPVGPDASFAWLLSACRNSGKTTCVLSFIINKCRKQFHDIIWLSPSVLSDRKVMKTLDDPSLLIQDPKKKVTDLSVYEIQRYKQRGFRTTGEIQKALDNEYVERRPMFVSSNFVEIMKVFGELKDGKKRLFVLDDLSASPQVLKSSALMELICNGRHHSASVIVLTQFYYSTPKALRLQMGWISLWKCSNRKELYEIYQQNSANLLSFETFLKMYRYATSEPYSSITFAHENSDQNRFVYNFSKFIDFKPDT